jgi:hypothetical protein
VSDHEDAAVSVQAPFFTGVSPEASTIPVRVTRELPFRIIPRIETYPRLVAFCQTVPGQAVLLTVFGLVYAPFNPNAIPLMLCLAMLTWMPHRRHQLVSVSTLIFALLVPLHQLAHPLRYVGTVSAIFLSCATLIACRMKWPQSWYGRNSVAILIAGFAVWIAAISLIPWQAVRTPLVWDLSIAFVGYIWYVAYILIDRQAESPRRFGLETGFLQPFWGVMYTPFPNGTAYLRQIEAKTPEQLAIVQLKGFKLLVWSTLILIFSNAFSLVCHGYLKIPEFTVALLRTAQHAPLPWFVEWASLIVYFLEKVMGGAVLSHCIIGCCRMAGFDALRNMYRPLSSTTVAEFFNRYYFYYKELLVTFFFFPVYLQQSTRRPKVRMAVAIFAAACLGNSFYHFTRDLPFIQREGLWATIVSFQSFFFYTVVLAIALIVSRLRKRKRRLVGLFRGALCPALSVCFFFCLLTIFAVLDHRFPLIVNLRFLGHLFFIG